MKKNNNELEEKKDVTVRTLYLYKYWNIILIIRILYELYKYDYAPFLGIEGCHDPSHVYTCI